jgi:HlyD family secretion protein
VPNAAIRQTPEGPAVWRLNAGEPALVPVTLGDTGLDGAVQVLAGVAVGDEIVVHSERALAAGARIRVVGQLTDVQP